MTDQEAIKIIMEARGFILKPTFMGKGWFYNDAVSNLNGDVELKQFSPWRSPEEALVECQDLNILAEIWNPLWKISFWVITSKESVCRIWNQKSLKESSGIGDSFQYAAMLATAEALKAHKGE